MKTLPATLVQPMAATDVAKAVADVSVGAPLQGTRNIAGPEIFALDELGKITLAAQGDQRTVITDNSAGMFAAASGDVLIAIDRPYSHGSSNGLPGLQHSGATASG